MPLNVDKSELLWENENCSIRRELLTDVCDECADLIKEHWEEIANYKDTIPLAPVWSRLHEYEKNNCLYVLTLREAEKLIGYSVFILNLHLHYESLLVGCNDVLFVTKNRRNSRYGIQLILESEKYLKSKGVNKITWHMKPHRSFAPILERLGYKHEELTYGRLL